MPQQPQPNNPRTDKKRAPASRARRIPVSQNHRTAVASHNVLRSDKQNETIDIHDVRHEKVKDRGVVSYLNLLAEQEDPLVFHGKVSKYPNVALGEMLGFEGDRGWLPVIKGHEKEAKQFAIYVNNFIHGGPQVFPLADYIVKIEITSKPIEPSYLPDPNEQTKIAAIDRKGIVDSCIIEPSNASPILNKMQRPDGALL